MNYTVKAGARSGAADIPSSKSYAHRMLICAALACSKSVLSCNGISRDIKATIDCLNALGAKIELGSDNELDVTPIGLKCSKLAESHECTSEKAEKITLFCNESGSTLRFVLPIACALGGHFVFDMAEGLAARPMDALIDVLEAHGVTIIKEKNRIIAEGKLNSGTYSIAGNISSQYISGLLMALPLLEGDSKLIITGNVESRDYISITESCIKNAGIDFNVSGNEYFIPGNQKYDVNERDFVEKDWSGAAFFLCMGALSSKGVVIDGMNVNSAQGDREILHVLENFGAEVNIEDQGSNCRIMIKKGCLTGQTIDASEIPDLVPTIAAVASLAKGTTNIVNAARLRYKESDRLKTTSDMLKSIGADVTELEDSLVIVGKSSLDGGHVDSHNDHRIAMAAAVAACGCKNEVTVEGSECVNKSFPAFWECLERMDI